MLEAGAKEKGVAHRSPGRKPASRRLCLGMTLFLWPPRPQSRIASREIVADYDGARQGKVFMPMLAGIHCQESIHWDSVGSTPRNDMRG